MKFGIHIPQIGRKAGPDAVTNAAGQAEDLGFDSIWVNDHLAIPAEAPYPPSASFYEPMITLTWAAAATRRVVLGTSVLVLPLRHPVHLAKEIATLDLLSGGRVILGAGVGWLQGEFSALGVPYDDRGRRTDESIDILRACWSQDPVNHHSTVVAAGLAGIRTLPQPGRAIPIWIGGNSRAALRRAVAKGDGWHGTRMKPAEARPVVAELRRQTAADFRITLRLFWDALEDDTDEMKRALDGYSEIGINGLVLEPRQRGLDDWMRAVEAVWRLLEPWQTA